MIVDFEAAKPSLGKDAKYVARSNIERRKDRFADYRKLGHAQKILFQADVKNKGGNIHRTRLCNAARAYNAESITLKISSNPAAGGAKLSGVQTCGSIWACPVCSKKIAAKRGAEIARAIDYMSEAGNVPIMVTNTARHHAGMSLDEFKTKFKQAHRYFVQHRRWRDLKAKFGIQHSIKAVEGTYGLEHGWHYHQHAILFLNADILKSSADVVFSTWVLAARKLWLHCLNRVGLDGIGEIAFDVQADHDVKKSYLAKLGLEDETSSLDHELSAGHNKTSGGAKIWQILQKSWEGDELYSKLYVEWVQAMSGDQWLVFSDGLKELCGIEEVTDEEASIFDGIEEEIYYEPLLEISDEEIAPVRKLQKVAELLELAAETRSKQAVIDWLTALEIEWNNSHAAAEQERLESQYRALDNKLANMRKGYNQRNEFPSEDSEFWRLVEQWRELKRRLGK